MIEYKFQINYLFAIAKNISTFAPQFCKAEFDIPINKFKIVNYLKEFRIPFRGLKIGKHDYDWTIDHKFFEIHDNSDVQDCSIVVKLELEKTERMLTLNFDIQGVLNANCDRCLDEIGVPIHVSEQYIFKFGPEKVEESENVMVIPETDFQIDITDLIYDFIVLAIPMQKFHGKDGTKPATCNKETLEYLENDDQAKEIDPRWEALKNIKIDNNN